MTSTNERIFLGWERPALTSAADRLIQRHAAAGAADLSRVIVALPSSRAGRRLVELLLDVAEERAIDLVPPRMVTMAGLADHLLPGGRSVATDVERELAWARALGRTDRDRLRRLTLQPPAPDDAVAWAGLARQVDALHTELSAADRSFADAADAAEQLAGFEEADRWHVLVEVHERYRQVLDEAGLTDTATARHDALQAGACHCDQDVVLLGMADLPIVVRRMIEQGARSCVALINAPESLADRFDDLGCIEVEAWADAAVDLDDETIEMVEGPVEQADAVLRAIGRLGGRFAADQITIGVADDQVAPYVLERAEAAGLPARYAAGRSLPHTGPCRLLAAAADYLDGRRYADLAALLRHPAIDAMVRRDATPDDDPLNLLDRYFDEHLPVQWSGQLIGAQREDVAQLARVIGTIERWLEPLGDAPRPRRDWPEAIANLLVAAYGPDPLAPTGPAQRQRLDALAAIRNLLAEEHDAHGELAAARVTAAQAMRLLLRRATADVPPPADDRGIELLGWLELPLDDAPVLVVTGMNDGFVPEAVVRDAFLPDRLRTALELTDNRRRRARDAYALAASVAVRASARLIAARRNAAGDPLPPSRLLLAADPLTVAQRIRRFYPEDPTPTQSPVHPNLQPAARSPFERWPAPPPPLTRPITQLRVTAFGDYLRCPYRFYLRHVLRLTTVDDRAVELDPARFGTLAHEVLSSLNQDPLRECTDSDRIAAHLSDELDRRFARRYGNDPTPAMLIQREQLRRRLRTFAQWQAEHTAAGWRIAHTELSVDDATLTLDGQPVRVAGQPFVLTGRIDRIDVHPDHGCAIFDYKTGDRAKAPDETHRRGRRDDRQWTDLQLPLYRHLAAARGIDHVDMLGYIVLPREAEDEPAKVAPWSDDDLADADELARRIIEKINRGDPDAFYPPAEGGAFDEFAAICGTEMLASLMAGSTEEGGES